MALKHGQTKVDSLKTNSLSSYRSALKLVRRYRVFTIQVNPNADFFEKALSNNWLITDVADKETSLFYDNTFLSINKIRE